MPLTVSFRYKYHIDLLDKWFEQRLAKSREDYSNFLMANPEFKNLLLSYKGVTYNILKLPAFKVSGVISIEEDSPIFDSMYRYITTVEDKRKTTGYLTFMLNNVETIEEADYVLHRKNLPSEFEEERKKELDDFINQYSDKLLYLERMKFIGELS